MSLYEEIWSDAEYEPRKTVYISHLVKNHLKLAQKAAPEFTDYKIYEKLGCYPYERLLTLCFNRGGQEIIFNDAHCRAVDQFFKSCIQNHAVLGHLKNTNPEAFATNSNSRERYSFAEIL